MKHFYLSLLLILYALNGPLIAQSFQWAKQMGGTGDDTGNAITTDASGNIYTIGSFQGKCDFDPGTDSLNITATGGQDIFISKQNPAGELIWVKQLGGASIDFGTGITVDASGNIYTIGFFLQTADFDPGANVSDLTSAGSYDIFISKLDASGNFVWVKQMGGTGADVGTAITMDAGGNIYVTGTFQETANFDTSSNTYSLTSAGGEDIFIAKLNPAGNIVWIKQMGGTDSDYSGAIALDDAGNIYTTGNFNDVVDFDPGSGTSNLTSAGTIDVFVSKLSNSGNFIWAKQMGGSGMDYANSITVDASNNIYVTGVFNSISDFNMGSGSYTLTSYGNDDIFIAKLNATGNFVWAKQMGGSDFDAGNSIIVDALGYVYTTGYFGGTSDFNTGPAITTFTSAGSRDIFISKLSPSGAFVWAKQMGGTGSDRGNAITIDAFGNMYATGNFEDTAMYNAGASTSTMSAVGAHDIYIYKLGDVVTSVTETNSAHPIFLYPNPTSGIVNIKTADKQKEITVEVYDQLGNKVMDKSFNNAYNEQFTIDASPGMYFITLKYGDTELSNLKLIKL